jgi:hypothetical protein
LEVEMPVIWEDGDLTIIVPENPTSSVTEFYDPTSDGDVEPDSLDDLVFFDEAIPEEGYPGSILDDHKLDE